MANGGIMFFQVSSSNTFIQPNERTEIITSQTLRKEDRYEQIFNGEELRQNGIYPDSRNQSVLFYFTLFIYFVSSDLDALKYGHSEGTGQMTSFKQREGWKR